MVCVILLEFLICVKLLLDRKINVFICFIVIFVDNWNDNIFDLI